MSEHVELFLKRNRGWPWPEESWGLTPMYGADGWCHSCGIPQQTQSGSLVLQRKGLTVSGSWIPNWQFNAICVDATLAAEVRSLYGVELLQVGWPRVPAGEAWQILIPIVGDAWFNPDDLRDRVLHSRTGRTEAGAACPECKVWKWRPIEFDALSPLRASVGLEDAVIAASPEWFGDGWLAYRQVLVRRDLAQHLAAASPRDFEVREIEWTSA